MKIEIFNQKTKREYNSYYATIRVNRQTGKITFNRGAVKNLNLKLGTEITFIQDKEQTTDWYIQITKGEDGFPLVKATVRSFAIFSITMATLILESMYPERKEKSVAFMLSTKLTEKKYYAIITHKKTEDKYVTPC